VKSLRKSSSEQGEKLQGFVMGELDKMASCLHDLLLQRQATLEIYKVFNSISKISLSEIANSSLDTAVQENTTVWLQ
jgi:hypothetical protein